MIGATLDKYEVLQKVGEGGMATVYRGRHSTLKRDVAIKVLHPHLSSSTRNRMRFAREAKAVERLRHDNILEIFDYSGQEASECYIVTEFVDGETLTTLLQRCGRLPSEVVALIGIRVARALAFAHDEGILHRDLKTDNVMVRIDGTVKLMDFGIARFLDESQVTMTGALVGSPAFMSPEQAREDPLDRRSDLFSFGTMLFYLVTGHLPFSGSNPSLILKNVIEGNRPNVAELAPMMSASLADIVERLLSSSADDRFNSAKDVEAALLACLHEVKIDLGMPGWELQAFLADSEAYEQRLDRHLGVVLLEGGRRMLEQGDHLAALRMFNRMLSMDEENEEVLALVQSLHGQVGMPGRRGALLAAGALVAVVLVVVALWVLSAAPTPADGRGPPVRIDPPERDLPTLGIPARPARESIDRLPVAEATASRSVSAAEETPIRRRRISRVAPPAPDPSEAPPDAEFGTVVINAGGLHADVYRRGTQIGSTGELLTLPAGSHDLEVKSAFVLPHVIPEVGVSAGERREIMVELTVRPARVEFGPAWGSDCRVALTDHEHPGSDLGSLGELGHAVVTASPHQRVQLAVTCPDGARREKAWPYIASASVRFPDPAPEPAVPGEASGERQP